MEGITLAEIAEKVKTKKIRITVEITPNEYGTVTQHIEVEPWEPFKLEECVYREREDREAVKPITCKNGDWIEALCGNCQGRLYYGPSDLIAGNINKPNYCRNCGRKVKWDG